MLSNHYPLAFASQYNWLIAGLVFLMGVTIRHYFNSRHARAGNPRWTWVATTAIFIIIMSLSIWPAMRDDNGDGIADILVKNITKLYMKNNTYDNFGTNIDKYQSYIYSMSDKKYKENFIKKIKELVRI